MMRFLGKTTASAARNGGSILSEVCAADDEVLAAWELVNMSQSDEEDLYSYDSDEMEPVRDDEEEESTDGVDDADADEEAASQRNFVSASDIIAIQAMSVSPPMNFPVVMARNYLARDYGAGCDDGDVNDDSDDDNDVERDYDFDEELVPWELKGRFGKQRITKMGIRKMGQRGGPKLTAKKLPYYDNRPGFSHGKLR